MVKIRILLAAIFSGRIIVYCKNSGDTSLYAFNGLLVGNSANSDIDRVRIEFLVCFMNQHQAERVYSCFTEESYAGRNLGRQIPETIRLQFSRSMEGNISSPTNFAVVLYFVDKYGITVKRILVKEQCHSVRGVIARKESYSTQEKYYSKVAKTSDSVAIKVAGLQY